MHRAHQNTTIRYRKHFNLPADWSAGGASVYLYFGGTFRQTTVWVNGQNVSFHESGCGVVR